MKIYARALPKPVFTLLLCIVVCALIAFAFLYDFSSLFSFTAANAMNWLYLLLVIPVGILYLFTTWKRGTAPLCEILPQGFIFHYYQGDFFLHRKEMLISWEDAEKMVQQKTLVEGTVIYFLIKQDAKPKYKDFIYDYNRFYVYKIRMTPLLSKKQQKQILTECAHYIPVERMD